MANIGCSNFLAISLYATTIFINNKKQQIQNSKVCTFSAVMLEDASPYHSNHSKKYPQDNFTPKLLLVN